MSSKDQYIDLNQYKKTSTIGSGGYSQVYLIEDNKGQKYAAKVSINDVDESMKDYQEIHMLFREINLMSSLTHPSIIKFIGYSPFDFDGEPFPTIIIEIASNNSLKNIIDLEQKGLSPEDWNDTKKLINIYGIASGMAYLHSKKIIHRDLKPDNILLNEYLHPKISDFGLSKTTDFISPSMNFKSDRGAKGTPQYIAPEIFNDNKYSYASDVYAFGIIVYEMLTGDKPFKFDNIFLLINQVATVGSRPKINEKVPEIYRNLIECCWSQLPEDRPTFDQIVEELKTNKEFITDSINKSEFFDFVNFIENSQKSFNISNRLIYYEDFVKSRNSDKSKRKVSINSFLRKSNSEDTTSSFEDLMASNRTCPLIEIEKNENLQRVKSNIELTLFSQSDFDNLSEVCQDLVCQAVFDRNKQFLVGKSLVEGINDFPTNADLGVQYLEKSIENKCKEALIYYAKNLCNGEFISPDFEKAEKIIEKAKNINDLRLFVLEGKIYRHNKKFSTARKFYKKAAKKDDNESMYQYGKMLFLGEGGRKSSSKSLEFLEKSVQNGYMKSVLFMAALNKLSLFKGFKFLPPETQYFFIKNVKNELKKGMNLQNEVFLIPPSETEKYHLNGTLKSYNFHRFLSNFTDVSIEVDDSSQNFKLILDLVVQIKQKKLKFIKIGIVLSEIVPKLWSRACFSEDINYHKISSKLNSLPAYAFYQCFLLTDITIPSSIDEIKEFSFFECSALTNVTIPSSVTKIGMSCFERCSSLQSIEIPSSVTLIGPAAFRECSKLKSISIPSSLTVIDYSTFEDCPSLSRISIPSSVIKIDDFAFSGCSLLNRVLIPDSVLSIGKNAFPKRTKLLKC